MAGPLHIVIVSYVDDNFGDNLIRISFQALLEVALANHGLSSDEYEITPMSLKHVDEPLLDTADAVMFAGGGLFGLSYLNFFSHLDQITAIAERRGIPVVFSSMGLNNMSAEDGSSDAIAQIVKRSCVKALAVRENLALFQSLAPDLPFEIRQVADPAVWTKYVYGMTDVVPDGTLGINVVRGGLFEANQRKWGLTAEMTYLHNLGVFAETAGMSTQFYTNGSLDDNNTLRFFAREYEVPSERVVLPQTTREVVEAIASRSAIASIRMHSSIIAYSFGIPTVALEWNDKLPFFYDAIGHPERLLEFEDWSPDLAFATLKRAGVAPQYDEGYEEYLMSTYTFVHEAVGAHVLGDRAGGTAAYAFAQVADALVKRSPQIDEDETDLRVKMGKVERAYLGRFTTLRAKDKELGTLRKQVATLEAKSARVAPLDRKVAALENEVATLKATVAAQKKELDLRFTTRVARYLRRVGGRKG